LLGRQVGDNLKPGLIPVFHDPRVVAPGEFGAMIRISFPDNQAKRQAMGRLIGRFSFKSWATGEMLVPEDALPFLTAEGIAFVVEGAGRPEG
jgi:hypothetical protein